MLHCSHFNRNYTLLLRAIWAYTHQSTRLQSQAQQCCAETNEQLEKPFPSLNPKVKSPIAGTKTRGNHALRAHHHSNTVMVPKCSTVPHVTITSPTSPTNPTQRLSYLSVTIPVSMTSPVMQLDQLQWLNCCPRHDVPHQGGTCCMHFPNSILCSVINLHDEKLHNDSLLLGLI